MPVGHSVGRLPLLRRGLKPSRYVVMSLVTLVVINIEEWRLRGHYRRLQYGHYHHHQGHSHYWPLVSGVPGHWSSLPVIEGQPLVCRNIVTAIGCWSLSLIIIVGKHIITATSRISLPLAPLLAPLKTTLPSLVIGSLVWLVAGGWLPRNILAGGSFMKVGWLRWLGTGSCWQVVAIGCRRQGHWLLNITLSLACHWSSICLPRCCHCHWSLLALVITHCCYYGYYWKIIGYIGDAAGVGWSRHWLRYYVTLLSSLLLP